MKPTFRSPGSHREAPECSRLKNCLTRGFTRLELLVTLVGAGVLLFVAFPTLAQSRDKAVRVMCLERLGRIGQAIRLFAENHGGRNATAVSVLQGGSADYLGSGATAGAADLWRHYWVLSNEIVDPRVLICPIDSARYWATNWAEMTGGSSSVRARNTSISYGIGTAAESARPSMILAADRSINWSGGAVKFVFNDQALRGNIGTNATLLRSMEWDFRGMHRAAGNVLFEDGSVARLNSARLREAWLNSGDSRNNYGQPGRSANR